MDETVKIKKKWERTSVTDLLRNRKNVNYYARVKVNGKQKSRARSLDPRVFFSEAISV